MDFNWKTLVKTLAPSIGTALGGPLGGLAATALTTALGLGGDSDEATIEQALKTATPEQLLALKQAEQQFIKDMRALDVDIEKIAMADRASARKREASVQGVGKYATPILAIVIIGGFYWAVQFALNNGIAGLDAASAAFVGTLIGYVSAKADQVVSYYFGSSAGSESKNKILAQFTKRAEK